MVDTSPLPEENKNKSNCKGYAHAFKKKKRKVPYEDICSWECTFPTQNPNPHSFPLSKILLHRKVLNEEVKFLGMYFFIPKLHPPFIPNLLRWQTDIAQLLVKLKENWNNASKVQRINTSCVSCVRLTLKTTASLENLLPKFAPPPFFFLTNFWILQHTTLRHSLITDWQIHCSDHLKEKLHTMPHTQNKVKIPLKLKHWLKQNVILCFWQMATD